MHPYYPSTLALPHYVPNDRDTTQLLAIVGTVCGIVLVTILTIARSTQRPALRLTWFLLCALSHCGFEVYWLRHHAEVAGRSDLVAELWKEYAHADSRYLSSDPVLYALELITAVVWGPLCIGAFIAIWRRSSSQYLWQLLASFGHLFSCSMYFALDFPAGFPSCDPSPYYFWLYFVSFNAPWLFIPALLSYQSICKIKKALALTSGPYEKVKTV
ncbi:putative EBP domain protein [Syncephalastrum racemosum]|uniref:Putative EBP domain protein n=1 Tax=Syncephalastrum racemosum TaxID=13706 RepID=A0A1X2HL50_SYNRA|nr:putative EBP domain protein [Syncephalastrum racemosum]